MSVLEHEFMQRALLAAALVGMAAPAIGVFLVQRRLSLMGDGIGHVAFTGVAAGLLTTTSPLLGGIAAASLGAVAIETLRDRGRAAGDVALALIFYGGIAGGAMLTYLAGASSRILEYLFGSVVTVTDGELLATGLVTGAVLCITVGLRRHLFAVCYDEETARVSGLPVRALNLLIALTAAVTVAVTMRVVGILLVSGMLVLPVAAVQQVTRSFVATMIGSLVLGMVLSVGGLIVAFYLDVVPGATIVLGAIAVFALATALSTGRRLRARARGA